MKINKKQIVVLVVSLFIVIGILFLVYSSMQQAGKSTVSNNDKSSPGGEKSLAMPKGELSEEEINGLVLMREEEKLARDVYTVLGERWNAKIFSNIASSEQSHTDAVKTLLDKYGIKDPVKNDDIGVFTSDKLSKLFKDLVEKGNESLLSALIVGATVEDLDIYDLNKLISETNNSDIRGVYENLIKGSRNHMRSFIKQINSNGGSYQPQYISQSEFDDIINSGQERGKK